MQVDVKVVARARSKDGRRGVRMLRVTTGVVLIAAALLVRPDALIRAQTTPAWPGGARMALSLSFDDGR